MGIHLTARLAWHDDGWNGHVCRQPAENTFCVGCYSYPGDMVAKGRDLEWEKGHAGEPIDTGNHISPCIYSANAFGSKSLTAFADPPTFFRDDTQTRKWKLPAASVCVWPYEEMYADDLKRQGGGYDNDERRARAKAFFEELRKDESLVFYYANYSNPMSEDEAQRYLLVGVSRIKNIGEELIYAGCSEQTRLRWGGGFVWDRTITSHYPDQGLRLPYHIYRDRPELMARFAVSPENPRTCKYGSKHISDDDALGLVEQFLVAVETLQKIGDKTDDWASRKLWLQNLIAELWDCRGLYPGLPAVLDLVKFSAAIPFFKSEVTAGREKKAFEAIFNVLDGKAKKLQGVKLSDEALRTLSRAWKLRTKDEQKLLKDTLPRFDLGLEQFEAILSSKRVENGITSSLKSIAENPYILAEQYIGNDPDDIIPWGRIDRGALPSPELGGPSLVELDDSKRMRALAVQCLQRDGKHTFLPEPYLTQQINERIAILPEYKRHIFTDRYWEVDAEFLSEALHLRVIDDRLFVYHLSNYEDERLIEKELKFLIDGPDIKLTKPVTESTWTDYLFSPESVLAQKAEKAYRAAIKGQVKACQRVFVRPLTVLAGAAGTGKTTVIKAIVKAIKKGHGVGASAISLAPTGKAADRIREILENDASLKGTVETATIHSFLAKRAWLNPNMTFKRVGGKLEQGYSTYIVDEASMLDLSLAACLFRAIDWKTVQRLILVGDPNQLPPIGCGRVFADIIEHLTESEPDSIATLKDNLRLLENRTAGRGTGILDLAAGYIRESLAEEKRWEAQSDIEEVLRKVQEGGDVYEDLRVVYWDKAEQLAGLLIDQITRDMEQDTRKKNNPERPYELWRASSDGQPERSQVLTPYRGELFGIEAINTAVQKYISQGMLDRVGAMDGITLFDKVIQVRNRPKSNMAYAFNVKSKSPERIEIFNGELGFVKPHGFDGNGWQWKKDFWLKHFQVVFSRKKDFWVNYGGELGKIEVNKATRWVPRQPVEENLELAYAISIHKAQGSEFERTYVIVPKTKTALLSPELFYTAVTRAKRHCTLFVEQDISALINMRRRERSHLLQINSSLFEFRPVPEPLLNLVTWYEEGKIHEALAGCMVRSKSEVILANLLATAKIPFRYEVPLFAPDGTFYLPDFTVEWRGKKFFWEHLGMLDKPEYRRKWEQKKQWYDKYFPACLLVTIESPKLSKTAEKLIQETFV
jgi:exodeoxyribonuclease V alpha subunit